MKKIAVVEDNPDNRLLVVSILSDLYEVSEYENGNEALKGIADSPPDLVLMDISLPGMEGTEVLKRLRTAVHGKDLPIIALTAHAMVGDREKYLQAGFQEYFSKPITDETLFLNLIQTVMNRRKQPG